MRVVSCQLSVVSCGLGVGGMRVVSYQLSVGGWGLGVVGF